MVRKAMTGVRPGHVRSGQVAAKGDVAGGFGRRAVDAADRVALVALDGRQRAVRRRPTPRCRRGGRRRGSGRRAAGSRSAGSSLPFRCAQSLMPSTQPIPWPLSPSGVPGLGRAHEAKYAHQGSPAAEPATARAVRGDARGRRSSRAAARTGRSGSGAHASTARPRRSPGTRARPAGAATGPGRGARRGAPVEPATDARRGRALDDGGLRGGVRRRGHLAAPACWIWRDARHRVRSDMCSG